MHKDTWFVLLIHQRHHKLTQNTHHELNNATRTSNPHSGRLLVALKGTERILLSLIKHYCFMDSC